VGVFTRQASGEASRGIGRLTPKVIAAAQLRSDEFSAFLDDGGGLYRVLKRVDAVVYKNWRCRFTSPVHARTADDGSVVYARRAIGLKSADAISLAGVRLSL
jgi:hypothetical protein